MTGNGNAMQSSAARRSVTAASLLAACLMTAPLALADELPSVSSPNPWTIAEESDDPANLYVMYTRSLPGSNFRAYRLEAVIDAPPAEVAAAARRNIADTTLTLDNTNKVILSNEGDVAYVYSYIDLPMVSDRDVITRSERFHDVETGEYRVEWTTSEEGPAPKPGVVRLTKSRGSWRFMPLPNDKTRAIYENHTEIGGMIPAWIVNPMMSSQVTSGITDLRRTVAKNRERAAATPVSLRQ